MKIFSSLAVLATVVVSTPSLSQHIVRATNEASVRAPNEMGRIPVLEYHLIG